MISIEELDQKAQQIIRQAGQNAYQKMENDYQIDTKTNYTDLVTTIDRENEPSPCPSGSWTTSLR